ncbi:MAG TPA: hypothetical protein ENI52_02680 [Thermoplasmata archaeon]|nr:hypothetical protein [Thermoplasmata archaeon]
MLINGRIKFHISNTLVGYFFEGSGFGMEGIKLISPDGEIIKGAVVDIPIPFTIYSYLFRIGQDLRPFIGKSGMWELRINYIHFNPLFSNPAVWAPMLLGADVKLPE